MTDRTHGPPGVGIEHLGAAVRGHTSLGNAARFRILDGERGIVVGLPTADAAAGESWPEPGCVLVSWVGDDCATEPVEVPLDAIALDCRAKTGQQHAGLWLTEQDEADDGAGAMTFAIESLGWTVCTAELLIEAALRGKAPPAELAALMWWVHEEVS